MDSGATLTGIRFSSAAGRWILLASILGSGLAGIDATVVNVALPAIGEDLNADFATLQWIVTSYTLTLASFILLGGSPATGLAAGASLSSAWFGLPRPPCCAVSRQTPKC